MTSLQIGHMGSAKICRNVSESTFRQTSMHHADVSDKKKLLPMQTYILSSNKIHMAYTHNISIHTTYPYTTSYTHDTPPPATQNIHIRVISNTHLVDLI